jgi:branched-subunit amino acid transport protein
MDQDTIFLTILGMTLVTYLPRLLPVLLLSSKTLPRLVEAWLRLVPMAVLAALVAPSLLVQDDRLFLRGENLYLWASIPTLFIAWRTKNLFLSVVFGMLIVALARMLLPS